MCVDVDVIWWLECECECVWRFGFDCVVYDVEEDGN